MDEHEFPAVARIGEAIALLDGQGIHRGSSGEPVFHRVEFIEPVAGIDLTGPTDLAINAPTEIVAAQIQNLEMPTNELLQVRYVIAVNGAELDANASVEVTMAQLRAVNRNVTARVQGVWSLAEQGFLLRTDLTPALTDVVATTAVIQRFSLTQFWQTEHYIFENDTPIYTLNNPGTASAGSSTRIDLRFTGRRYILSPMTPQGDWEQQTIMGKEIMTPRAFARVPITGMGR